MSKKIFLSVLTVLALAGLGLWFFITQVRATEVMRPRMGDVVESIYGLGTVTPSQVYHMRSAVVVAVRKLFVTEGDLVKEGDLLVQLDERKVHSAIRGTVTAVAYRDGEIVPPQASVITVTNLEKLYLEVSLEQQSILRIKRSQSALVSFESLRNERIEGVVASVYPRDSQFIIRIELQKWPTGVLPGMTADVAILVGKKTNVLLVPLRSIVGGQVTRLRRGKKERLPITLGVVDGEWGEVTSDNIAQDDELLVRK